MDPGGEGTNPRRRSRAPVRLEPDRIRFDATRLPSGLFRHRATAYEFHLRERGLRPRR